MPQRVRVYVLYYDMVFRCAVCRCFYAWGEFTVTDHTCTICHKTKKGNQFTQNMRLGHHELICSNCVLRFINTYKCTSCDNIKLGEHFTRDILIDGSEPTCNQCKVKEANGYNWNAHKNTFDQECLCCGKTFQAKSKYNRLCKTCKSPDNVFSFNTYGV